MIYSNQVLHPYTNLSTETFCYRFVQLFHQGKLAKTEHQKFLDLFESVLPIPNNLRKNMSQLLSLLEMKENFFRKRVICLICSRDIPDDLCFCSVCTESNDTNIAIIYDADIQSILKLLLNKLWDQISQYKTQIRLNHDT